MFVYFTRSHMKIVACSLLQTIIWALLLLQLFKKLAFCSSHAYFILFFPRLSSLGEMAFSELTTRAVHLYDEWIKDAGELSHSSCHLLDFDLAVQSSNGTSPPLRPQGGGLVSHVLPAATNGHPAFLHLLCHIIGAQVDGEPQAL